MDAATLFHRFFPPHLSTPGRDPFSAVETLLQVLVTPLAVEAQRGESLQARRRMPGEAWLISVKTRKAQ